MRLCFIADGVSIHTKRWVNYFAQKGHEVHLISWGFPAGYEGYDSRVQSHSLIRLLPQIWKISGYISGILWLLQVRILVKKIKPDILHAHFIEVPAYLGIASGFHPLIVSAWGSDVLVSPKSSALRKIGLKFTLRKANIILTNSQYMQAHLRSEYGLSEKKDKLIPWGIDLGIFHKGYESEVEKLKLELGVDNINFVVLSPRHLKDLYRIEYIVQAMPFILSKYPSTILILCKGATKEKEYETKIDALSSELGVSRSIRMLRRELRPQEMAVLYNASDAFISIPKSDLFAVSIQEGMACGVIPVIGNLEAYHEYLTDGKNALYVKSEEPEEIGKKIVYCIEHPELKERFYAINKEIIEEKKDWNKNAQKMEDLYIDLLRNEASRNVP